MPEWYLITAGLVVLSLLGLAWWPLLLAAPLAALALAAPVGQAVKSAAAAQFTSRPRGLQRLKLYGLTAFLHLMQPAARLRGRIKHGLTLWRRRAGRKPSLPVPGTETVWSEEWRSIDTWLRALDSRLRANGAVGYHGGDFDGWDIEVRGGLLGGARLTATVEEHGGGRQFLRFRVVPRWSVVGAGLVALLGGLAAAAAVEGAYVAAGILGAAAALVAVELLVGAGLACGAIRGAARSLPEGAEVVPVSPAPAAEARPGDLAIIRRLVAMARPQWGHIAGLALLTLLATPIALLAPIPTAIVVDSVLSGRPLPDWVSRILPAAAERSDTAILVVAFALTVGIALVRHLNGLATWLLQVYTGERLVLEFRTRLLQNAQRLSFGFHDRRGVADSTYRIQYDAASIQWVLIYSFISIFSASVTLLAMFAVTARIDVRLALVALGVAPVLVALSVLSRSRLKRQWVDVKRFESSAMGVVQEALGATRVVRAFGREDHEEARFTNLAREGLRTRVRVSASEGVYQLAVGLALATATGLVMVVGARQVQAGEISLGELLIVLAYLAQLLAPLSALSTELASLQGWFVSAGRALELLDERPDVVDSPSARPLDRARGHIEFHNVWMAYEDDRWALQGVTFEVRPGMRVGIQGQTGAGKSTILSLLPRFYDPAVGAILLDGVDLRQYRLADLRGQFAIALQEPVLFGTTIGDNIAYARPGASRAEIVQAAIAANAHDFIAALPQGYDTEVGERGLTLSGGERQRISLARAFLKDAPILILDEPTSSVDTETETAIMEAIDRLMVGRTAFVVAHRLSTLARCDVRLRVQHGAVEALRPHRTRVVQEPVFQHVWEPPA